MILGHNIDEIKSQINAVKKEGIDFVEIRLDQLNEIEIDELSKLIEEIRDIRIILSLRSHWNSKEISPPLSGRRQILQQIIDIKPDYLDLEYPIDMGLLNSLDESTVPVITAIDFEGMAKIDFESISKLAKNYDGECFVKLSSTPNSVEDLRQLWRWSKKLRKMGLKYIIVGMGQLGQLSRIKSRELGNSWTYGRFDPDVGEPYLPGMISIKDLKQSYANDSWHLASLGNLPNHDALRTIYSELFNASSLNGVFLNIPIKTSPELDQFLLWVEDGLLDGLNISSPWQVDILDKIPLKDYSTEVMGAANCVTVTKDGLKAYNTQISAMRRALEPFSLKRIKRVYIDGTERVARALIEVFKDSVELIVIRDEMFSQGNAIFDDYSNLIPSTESYSNDFDLVVNCNTPAKGFENVVMLPRKIVQGAKIIFDPMSKLTTPTPLMNLAETLDIKYVGGYQFFFNTALTSFELWTKRSIPPSSIDSELFNSFEDKIDFGFMLNY